MEELKDKVGWIFLMGFFLILTLPILVLPLYFWLTPFVWGKTIVFRIILSLLILFFIWQVLAKDIKLSDIKNKIKPASLPIFFLISFFFLSLLATIFSLDIGFSLWGDPGRAGGFVNFAFYVVFSFLTFLTLKRKDWQKLWDFTIIIGILLSAVAIFQNFGIFKKFLVPVDFRPSSTTGNPIFLAIYLLLLTFPCFSFAIRTKNILRKIFYGFSFLLFLAVSVILTQTRAAILGLSLGFLWFFFAYPKKLGRLKLFAAVFLIFIVLGAYSLKIYLDSRLYIYQKIPTIPAAALHRALNIFSGIGEAESRISAWKVSFAALWERPVLGYGPENFEIAFNKYYDPSLPIIGRVPSGEELYGWWDRAHNFLFDIAITVGLPALIIYLSFFAVLGWQLQKVKKKEPETAVISHGVQATFIGYLTANLFSFDSFDTYLILFFLIGYAFYLISSGNNEKLNETQRNNRLILLSDKLYRHRKKIVVFIFFLFLWFILVFNIKPLIINKQLNSAFYDFSRENYGRAFETIDKLSYSHSILDSYIRESSVEIIRRYVNNNLNNPKLAALFTRKSIYFLQENTKARPYRLQDRLLSGEKANFLISQEKRFSDEFINTEELSALKEEANQYFNKAILLSPKRPEIYEGWAKTGLLTQDYEMAKEKAQNCIDLNQNYSTCYWLMALSHGHLKNNEQFDYYLNIAKEKQYDTKPGEGFAPFYASLAAIYKEMGEFKKAEEAALKVLDFEPSIKTEIDEFLKTLK